MVLLGTFMVSFIVGDTTPHFDWLSAAIASLIVFALFGWIAMLRISSECLVSLFAKGMSQSNMESNAEKSRSL
jgi:hypothetical protein